MSMKNNIYNELCVCLVSDFSPAGRLGDLISPFCLFIYYLLGEARV
jgi:hypothetical protein